MKKSKWMLVLFVFAVISLMLGAVFSKAFADDERGKQQGRQQQGRQGNDRGQQRGWNQREHMDYHGERYDYHEGRFYRPGLFGFILDLVLPPRGIVVNYLPTGYRTIYVGRTMYYEYENTYYQTCPGGYIVVQPPVVIDQYAPSPVVYAPSVVVSPGQPQSFAEGTVVVNVPTATRGIVAITLVRYSNGFSGPQGEFYPNFPSTQELSARYGQ